MDGATDHAVPQPLLGGRRLSLDQPPRHFSPVPATPAAYPNTRDLTPHYGLKSRYANCGPLESPMAEPIAFVKHRPYAPPLPGVPNSVRPYWPARFGWGFLSLAGSAGNAETFDDSETFDDRMSPPTP
jgi:hypothetical protein